MSSNNDSSTVQRLSTNGAADYLVKPVTKAQLGALRRLLVQPAVAAATTPSHKRRADGTSALQPSSKRAAGGIAAAADDDDAQTSGSNDSHNTVSAGGEDEEVGMVGCSIRTPGSAGDVSDPAELLRACMAKAAQDGAWRREQQQQQKQQQQQQQRLSQQQQQQQQHKRQQQQHNQQHQPQQEPQLQHTRLQPSGDCSGSGVAAQRDHLEQSVSTTTAVASAAAAGTSCTPSKDGSCGTVHPSASAMTAAVRPSFCASQTSCCSSSCCLLWIAVRLLDVICMMT